MARSSTRASCNVEHMNSRLWSTAQTTARRCSDRRRTRARHVRNEQQALVQCTACGLLPSKRDAHSHIAVGDARSPPAGDRSQTALTALTGRTSFSAGRMSENAARRNDCAVRLSSLFPKQCGFAASGNGSLNMLCCKSSKDQLYPSFPRRGHEASRVHVFWSLWQRASIN